MLNLTQLVGFGAGGGADTPVVGTAIGTTTATMPAHQSGDLLIGYAFRDGSNTAPSLPSGWTNGDNSGANSCSARLGYKVATSSGETSGTWTNATSLIIVVLRGVTFQQANDATGSGTDINDFPGFFLGTSGPFWILFFAGHTSIDTELADNTSVLDFFGYTSPIQLIANNLDATDHAVAYIATLQNNTTGNEGFGVLPAGSGGTSSGYMTCTLVVS